MYHSLPLKKGRQGKEEKPLRQRKIRTEDLQIRVTNGFAIKTLSDPFFAEWSVWHSFNTLWNANPSSQASEKRAENFWRGGERETLRSLDTAKVCAQVVVSCVPTSSFPFILKRKFYSFYCNFIIWDLAKFWYTMSFLLL